MTAFWEGGGEDAERQRVQSGLFTSSTKQRISELHALHERLANEDLPVEYVHTVLDLLFDTYAFYVDRSSRQAVLRCLKAVSSSENAERYLVNFVKNLRREAAKSSLPSTSALVLTEWCSFFNQQFASRPNLWKAWGTDVIVANAQALETCLSSETRQSIKQSALVSTRRGLRKLLNSGTMGGDAIGDIVKILATKSASPNLKNAILLGVVAGVSARSADLKTLLTDRKKDYYEFYVRELIGSKSVVPNHIATGLNDFFAAFTTEQDLSQEVIPAIEKAILRAPEIVLNGIITEMVRALPTDLDMSRILHERLLKPLLASVKSTNAAIRDGARTTFEATALRCYDGASARKIAEEILPLLKQSKVSSPEQRAIYAKLLSALPRSAELAAKIPHELAQTALKETNESVLNAEICTIGIHVHHGIKEEVWPSDIVIEAFERGLSDKKASIRRLWALQAGQILECLTQDQLTKSAVIKFARSTIRKMSDIWPEVLANPVAASQSGLLVVAYIFSFLSYTQLSNMNDETLDSCFSKGGIVTQSLMMEPKPSFLLNYRVYTKLTTPEDMLWGVHALAAFAEDVARLSSNAAVRDAWMQSLLYFLTGSAIPPKVRDRAVQHLTSAYAELPQEIGRIVISGVWLWYRNLEFNEKESAAFAAKTGASGLHLAIKCICLSPEEFSSRGKKVDEQTIQKQLLDMLILCHGGIIPQLSWIDCCLKTGIDPGELARSEAKGCLEQILHATRPEEPSKIVRKAAYDAAADLAFVAPDKITAVLVKQLQQDLDSSQLQNIGPTEAAIFRTPEGALCVDVLAKKTNAPILNKNSKDYETLKWEQDMRESLEQRKGLAKKLSPEEQALVTTQLAQESKIRRELEAITSNFRRGVGIIRSLATGPPTDTSLWFGPAVELLRTSISLNIGMLLDQDADLAYLECARQASPRLGSLRPFIGVATLRATGNVRLPDEMLQEPLGDLVTRILYSFRFSGGRRPFDSISLIYILPLIFLVLEQSGIGKTNDDEVDEQITLALETISVHTELFTDPQLPRAQVLFVLLSSMQKFTQSYKLIKECLTNICRSIASNFTEKEINTLLKGCILPETAVRNAVLQAIDAELDISELNYAEQIWLAFHDDSEENADLAKSIWEENDFRLHNDSFESVLPYLARNDSQLRRAAARALAAIASDIPDTTSTILSYLYNIYKDKAKPEAPELDGYGMPRKVNKPDAWEPRHGVALAFKELSSIFPSSNVLEFVHFLISDGPLADKSSNVRDEMVEAAISVISARGKSRTEEVMKLLEEALESSTTSTEKSDSVNEAVVLLYGAVARHLRNGDSRVPTVIYRLFTVLDTPSESVQYAVAECLPPLVQASAGEASKFIEQMLEKLLHSAKYASRRGAAYGLAGVVRGVGVSVLKECRVMVLLKGAIENRKDQNQRQGAFLAFEILSLMLRRVFEPYVIQNIPQLLTGFGDPVTDVREACLDAAKTCFASLSSYGVKQVLPKLLEGLEDPQWRSKKGACDSLGAMAYLDPQQLASSLQDIIPPLTNVLNDSHKEVRASANRSLRRFGEVISNPEIKSVVSVLLKALSDPTKYTEEALDSLLKVSFTHFLDAPSLALVVRILERGLGDRSSTKRKAAQIIGSLAHLTERKDLIAYLPILVAGLRVAVVDPVPTTRATASKALGSMIEKLGEDALPDLIPSLMATLRSDTGAGDRLGSAQALSEVLAGLGTTRLEETLPAILQNISSAKPSVREGFMSLFIFLPACFGNSFAPYLNKIIPPILSGLADDVETIRETALRAGRLLVKNFSSRAIDLLLPELERGLADDSYRIRLSSVELVGDLLFNITGISARSEQDEVEDSSNEAGQSLLGILGEEKRNRVLSALYICRCDTSGLVRTAAINVWKALVASPRTLKELVPTLTQLIIRRLASPNMEQKVIAGNALGELIRKAGEGVLATLLPTLENGLAISTDTDSKEGICIALRELIASASPETLEDYEKTLISIVRTALVDPNAQVREAAAEAFDALQRISGKKAVDQVLPNLLNLLRTQDAADNALSALLTLLADNSRSNIILPNLLPTLLTSPISAFNARAIASLAEVASTPLIRRLPTILSALMDNVVTCKDDDLRLELDNAINAVLLSVDEFDGLNTVMSVMLALVKDDDHRKRSSADEHLGKFFSGAEIDISRYHQHLIRVLLIAFDDSDSEVVKAAWGALSELTKRLRKEEMESLVISTRQILCQVGVPGHDLPGFALPKGINAILPIFLQGLMNGTAEQRTEAALAISDIIDRTSGESLRPFVTQITGPLIRVVSERSTDVKAAVILTLKNLLEKIPTFLKPFLPQLQRTFAKSLADPSSEILRARAAKALGTLITLTPRIDPLIAELVTGAKTSDPGVKNAMFKALYEVVSKAGANMNETSKNSILNLIHSGSGDIDDTMTITNAQLLGALVKNLPREVSSDIIRNRLLTTQFTVGSILALNSILVEYPEILADDFSEETAAVICQGFSDNNSIVTENCVLAAGKFLLTAGPKKPFEVVKSIFEALAPAMQPGQPTDVRRLALVVIRTVSRHHTALVRPHLPILAPSVFAGVRDPVIPVKLSAEAAFIALFSVVEEESVVFDKYLTAQEGKLQPNLKRSMQDYFKRVALRLGAQAKERQEAEGGEGGLGLSSDEKEDEREVWSVGKVDLGEATFRND